MSTCPFNRVHAPPAHLADTFPIFQTRPDLTDLTKALATAWAECPPCIADQRAIAVAHRPLTGALSGVLVMWLCIVRSERELPTVDNGAALLDGLLPSGAQPAPATLNVLAGLPLSTEPGPLGKPVNLWDHAQLNTLIAALTPEDAALVWEDALAFLLGVLRGEARAMKQNS